MQNLLNTAFFGVTVNDYLLFFSILLLALILRSLFDRYLSRLLMHWAQKTEAKYDDMFVDAITPPLNALFISVGLLVAVSVLDLPVGDVDIRTFVLQALKIATSIIFVWVFYRLCAPVTEMLRDFMSKSDGDLAAQFAPLMRQAMRVSVVAIGGILIIQNLGYSVSSLLAGLGVGGLAVALAAQDTVANLFGTFVMFTDRPFKVGDWVQFKDVDGDVEAIGFRSTKVRTWSKSLKVIPNKVLTSEIIENWSAMPKRRVKMTFGITYDSTPEQIEALIARIKTLLKTHPGVDQDYMLVNFTGFGSSQLDIFLYYFTATTVWAEYMEIRQDINLKIMKIVEELGLAFAFPSQSVYFENPLTTRMEQNFRLPDDPTLPQ